MGQPTRLTQRLILKDHRLSWVIVRVNTNPNLYPNRRVTASSRGRSPVYLHVFAVRYHELHKSKILTVSCSTILHYCLIRTYFKPLVSNWYRSVFKEILASLQTTRFLCGLELKIELEVELLAGHRALHNGLRLPESDDLQLDMYAELTANFADPLQHICAGMWC